MCWRLNLVYRKPTPEDGDVSGAKWRSLVEHYLGRILALRSISVICISNWLSM